MRDVIWRIVDRLRNGGGTTPDEFFARYFPELLTEDVPETLAEQVRALLPHIPNHERVPFLAGMRFAQGHAEYGSGLFRIADEKLAYERDCEKADVYVMGLEQKRRTIAQGGGQ